MGDIPYITTFNFPSLVSWSWRIWQHLQP